MESHMNRRLQKLNLGNLNVFLQFLFAFIVSLAGIFLLIFSFAKLHYVKRNQGLKTHQYTSSNQLSKTALFYPNLGGSNSEINNSISTKPVQKYTVHLKSVKSQEEAESTLKILNKHGYFGYYTPVQFRDTVVYHVRIGIYSDEEDAQNAASKIQKKISIKGSVSKLQ